MTTPLGPGEWLAASLRGARILIIDDDKLQCGHLARIVEEWEAIAFTAQTLSDALRHYKEGNPDLVMCDVLMPHVDGYTFIRTLRAKPQQEGGQTPAVALTAYSRPEDARAAMAAGYQECLAKPAEPRRLANVVAYLCAHPP